MMIPQIPTVAAGTGTIHVQVDKRYLSRKDERGFNQGGKGAGQSLCLHRERHFRCDTGSVPGRFERQEGRPRVRATSFRLPDLTKLLKLVAISSKEEVLNYLLNNYPRPR